MTLCMMLSLLPLGAGAADSNIVEVKINECTVTFDTATGTVTKVEGDGDLNLPSKINGVTVTTIGSYAFQDANYEGKVTLPDTVTVIEESAFEDSSLREIVLPKGLKKLGASAFYCCRDLIGADIPDGITALENNLFAGCHSFAHVTLPKNLQAISYDVFSVCNLTKVDLPPTLQGIGASAFSDNKNLKEINLPDSIEIIAKGAFSGTGLTKVTLPPKLTEIADRLFDCCPNLTDVTIPSGVTRIGEMAFKQNESLKQIKLPKGLKSIGFDAFGNTGLTQIDIPASVETIEDYAFYDCPGLARNGMVIVGNILFQYTGEDSVVTIPNGVTKIGCSAFQGCTTVTEVTIPNTVTEIGEYAFNDCTSLKSITIPDSVTKIGKWAFGNCSSMTSVKMRPNLKDIGEYAFYGCDGLAKDGMVIIGNMLYDYVGTDEVVTVPNSVTGINHTAFQGSEVREVILPDSVTSMGEYVFSGCHKLEKVTFPSGMKSLPKGTFFNCWSITDMVLPDTLETIGSMAFYNTALKTITFPPSLTTIGNGAFLECSSYQEIRIPSTVTDIGDHAFGLYQYIGSNYRKYEPIPGVTIYGETWSAAHAYANTYGVAFVPTDDDTPDLPDIPDKPDVKPGEVAVTPEKVTSYYQGGKVTFYAVAGSPVKSYLWQHWYEPEKQFIDCENTVSGEGKPYLEFAVATDEAIRCVVTFKDGTQAISNTAYLDYVDPSTVRPTPTPSAAPKPTASPTPKPTAAPKPTPTPTPKPTASPAPTKQPAAANPFTDVAKNQYYYDPVLWAVKQGVTQGTSATTFSPAATCTRGQVVTFLWRAAGEPKPTGTKNPFTDVKSADYFYNAVLWAVEKGITQGTSKTAFSPASPCTRAHVVTFLWRSEGQAKADAKNPFTDVKSGDYYYNAVLWAVKNNITAGTSATTFSPANPCTRGQIVTFLYRDMAK